MVQLHRKNLRQRKSNYSTYNYMYVEERDSCPAPFRYGKSIKMKCSADTVYHYMYKCKVEVSIAVLYLIPTCIIEG